METGAKDGVQVIGMSTWVHVGALQRNEKQGEEGGNL